MTVHAVAYLYVKDPDMIARYRDKAAAALAKHGGSVLQGSAEPRCLEGDIETPTLIAILSFPDKEAAMAWHNDPDLADTHALRTGGGSSNIFLL